MSQPTSNPQGDGVITEHYASLSRGGIAYLAAGPADGPVLIFIHGWPELAISWRHQLPAFGQLGFRAIAVDMPGYGRSTIHQSHDDYALEKLNQDLIELLDSLGVASAVWIGHDWGSPVVWSLAAHYPERCTAVASLCVPYRTVELGTDHLISLVDRTVYDPVEHPAGPWDYMRFYEQSFGRARGVFEKHTAAFFSLMFQRGDPAGFDQPTITAGVCARGGWFGEDAPPPDVEMDPAIVDQGSLAAYVAAFVRTGFFGADSYYLNSAANKDYTARSIDDGYLNMPALFIAAEHDFWCDTERNVQFGLDMRERCRKLTAVSVSSGHWLSQEQPTKVNAALAHWLATKAHVWPDLPAPAWK